MRLSIVIEWANTHLHGASRAGQMLQILAKQWQEVTGKNYPTSLKASEAEFLSQFDPVAELIIVTGKTPDAGFKQQMQAIMPEDLFDLKIIVSEGAGYHAQKHLGAQQATGGLLLFLDSDVIPDSGWLAYLLSTFAAADVQVAFGQPYVKPQGIYATAFSVGWIYEPRDEIGEVAPHHKLFPNNTAFRSETYWQTGGFLPLGSRSRGASSQVKEKLASQGISVWQNSNASVDHPAPMGWRHFAVRALAHARDFYMASAETRHLGGLADSLHAAVIRMGHAWRNTFIYRRRVGLKPWEIPGVLGVITLFYSLWMLGGLMTHIEPAVMGRQFRV